jgi:hypothetical protein
MLDAWLAKFAAPGMSNPADQTPTLTGQPSQTVQDSDTRTHGQRQHDALAALVRGQLGDPKLRQHNGLPVTVIASATLDQICTATGHAVTGGGSLLPMGDLIRMAAHAYHYLSIFDKHTERALYLGRIRRIATADQRIVLHAKDHGCTAPGCDVPGYLTDVHHVDDWATGGPTNIDRLTFACPAHHRLLTPGGWKTRKRRDGTTEWLPRPSYHYHPVPTTTTTPNDYSPTAVEPATGWSLGCVSYIRSATATAETAVIAAAVHTAARNPHRSAATPPTTAPTAYPLSRQSRYTPTDRARHSG